VGLIPLNQGGPRSPLASWIVSALGETSLLEDGIASSQKVRQMPYDEHSTLHVKFPSGIQPSPTARLGFRCLPFVFTLHHKGSVGTSCFEHFYHDQVVHSAMVALWCSHRALLYT
jgi:hypothetical protein